MPSSNGARNGKGDGGKLQKNDKALLDEVSRTLLHYELYLGDCLRFGYLKRRRVRSDTIASSRMAVIGAYLTVRSWYLLHFGHLSCGVPEF
eukprot:scaffold766_cov179-Amphora_coffeaeformis.AAC.2